MVYCVFWVYYVFFASLFLFFFKYCADVCFIYLFIFNIVLTWKIVGASKVSVLYIYIDYTYFYTFFHLHVFSKNTNNITPLIFFLLKM